MNRGQGPCLSSPEWLQDHIASRNLEVPATARPAVQPDELAERLAKLLLPPLENQLERLEALLQDPPAPDLTQAVRRISASVCSVMDERRRDSNGL